MTKNTMTPMTIMEKPFTELKDGEWDYDLISPFFALRRNGNLLEIRRCGYYDDYDYYKEEKPLH